jgi:adenylate cyclase
LPKSTRKLAAIMFTDMVGYTALGQRNESLSVAVVDEQRKLVRPILTRHNGKEVKTMGDAFLVEFPDALDAVRCAYDIQRATRELNISLPQESRIHLRVGVHLGDIIVSDGDMSGDAVNVASRIEPLAEDGGVCLTRQVFDQVRHKFDAELTSIGTPLLKNVSTSIEVFKMVMPWNTASGAPARLDQHRMAVLPFSNMSPDPNDEYFADGMTEELISTISRIGGLKVIARTSVMGYKGSGRKIGEIANELGSGTILEGSVRKSGNKVRITAQLIDAKTGDYVWSEAYDRSFEDVFAIQGDIARKVADALKVRLLTNGVQQSKRAAKNTEAYTHYLKGRYFWNQRELEGLNKALKEFESAVQKDPGFAPAYAGLADTHHMLGRNGHIAPKYEYPRAIENAQKAIALDPLLPDPHVALAAIKQEYEWKWAEAEQQFKDAIALNPSNPIAHSWYALCLGHMGRIQAGISEARMGQELDPLSPRAHCAASEEYLFARQFDDAIAAAERALEISPNFTYALVCRAYALVEMKKFDMAFADFLEADRQYGARALAGRLGHAYAVSGRKSEATKILEDLTKETKKVVPPANPFIPPPADIALDVGLVYLGLDDKKNALAWLDKATEARIAEVIHFKCEPIYDNIRDEPDFRKLIRKIGLENQG